MPVFSWLLEKLQGSDSSHGASFDCLKCLKNLGGDIVYAKQIQSHIPSFAKYPEIDGRIIEYLKSRGIAALYSHQSRAVSLALSGRNIVIATPTASGKSMCYNLPVLDSMLKDGASHALYIFPTKALAQDQLAKLSEFKEGIRALSDLPAYSYDGDTPKEQRAYIRHNARVLFTNPEMLSAAVLPHHASWIKLYKNLKYIVVDELHMYRGVFGSHMANIFSRLKRICEYYGSKPVFICCSATIANPKEHAFALTGEEMKLVLENGAPAPVKNIFIYKPNIASKAAQQKRSPFHDTVKTAADALCYGTSTIVFAKSRIHAELILSQLRLEIEKRGHDPSIVQGYRGGYTAQKRRVIEQELRSGRLKGVVSTNALELGVDIGHLELAVLHGCPVTLSSARQEIGRAGRRGKKTDAVIVLSEAQPDMLLAKNPKRLFDAPSEFARINPLNPYIFVPHIKCALHELPFCENETFGGQKPSITKEILEYLANSGIAAKTKNLGRISYFWSSPSYPAAEISLRTSACDIYTITDITNAAKPTHLGTMDAASAVIFLYRDGIYFHEGKSYIVKNLDREKKTCHVEEIRVSYYTKAYSTISISILKETENEGNFAWGDAKLAIAPSFYRKIDIKTDKVIGQGAIDLPEEEIMTTACRITMPHALCGTDELKTAMSGLSYLLRSVVPELLMCDINDIQIQDRLKESLTSKPAILIADSTCFGVGLADGIFEKRRELIKACLDVLSSCPCTAGCFACLGEPCDTDLKKLVMYTLERLI